jgi:signal transduction histidine kinase
VTRCAAGIACSTDEDELRRARLVMGATGAVVLYVVGAAGVGVWRGDLAAVLAAAVVAVPAAIAFATARARGLVAAQWTTAAVVACGSIALIAVEGPVSSRLGVLQIGVVLLGLAARPWMAVAVAALAVAAVEVASTLGLALPRLSSATPIWLALVEQIMLTTALMMTYTRGYSRLHAVLLRRTAKLEAAHADLTVASEHLEHLVDERTAKLERAAVNLAAFTSTVAHDLRAPLRHVRYHLEVVLEDAAALGEARLAPVAAVLTSAAELTTRMEAILATQQSRRRPPTPDPSEA